MTFLTLVSGNPVPAFQHAYLRRRTVETSRTRASAEARVPRLPAACLEPEERLPVHRRIWRSARPGGTGAQALRTGVRPWPVCGSGTLKGGGSAASAISRWPLANLEWRGERSAWRACMASVSPRDPGSSRSVPDGRGSKGRSVPISVGWCRKPPVAWCGRQGVSVRGASGPAAQSPSI